MKEFIEKLIERLEKYCKPNCNGCCSHCHFSSAIGIVNEVAEEYKDTNVSTIDAGELLDNGWIPCEKEKPPINQNILVYDVISGMYIERLEEDEEFIGTVVAWQPLPAPYQPKGE